MSAKKSLEKYFSESASVISKLSDKCGDEIQNSAQIITDSFRNGGKLLLCGNGGSAADCQHMAAEFVSRLTKEFERPGLPAIALTTDTSFITAFANDCGFEGLFARQVQALGKPEDVLLGISTSGTSRNVALAMEEARRIGMKTIALTGKGNGIGDIADSWLRVPSTNTQLIQQAHLCIEHIICEIVEKSLFSKSKKRSSSKASSENQVLEQLELVIHSPEKKVNVKETELILMRHCQLAPHEVRTFQDTGMLVVKRTDSREQLEKLANKLRKKGIPASVSKPFPTRKSPMQTEHRFADFFENYREKLADVMKDVSVAEVEHLVEAIRTARENNRQIIFLGNGGSAATASHMVTDLSKDHFDDEALLFRAISLNDNASFITATGNDFGYDKLFVQQLKNILQPDDLVIAISSSGNSDNVIRAIEYANNKRAHTYGIVGFDGGKLLSTATNSIHIPTKKGHYGYMEDVTLIINHIIAIYLYESDYRSQEKEKLSKAALSKDSNGQEIIHH